MGVFIVDSCAPMHMRSKTDLTPEKRGRVGNPKILVLLGLPMRQHILWNVMRRKWILYEWTHGESSFFQKLGKGLNADQIITYQ